MEVPRVKLPDPDTRAIDIAGPTFRCTCDFGAFAGRRDNPDVFCRKLRFPAVALENEVPDIGVILYVCYKAYRPTRPRLSVQGVRVDLEPRLTRMVARHPVRMAQVETDWKV